MPQPTLKDIFNALQTGLTTLASANKALTDTNKAQADTIGKQQDSISLLTHDRDSAVTAAKANADDAQAARDLRDFIVANADKLGITLPQ